MTLSKDHTPLTQDDHAAIELLRTLGTIAPTWAPKAQRLLEILHDLENPLRAIDYNSTTSGGGNNPPDPTGDTALTPNSHSQERARIRKIARAINNLDRELEGMAQQHDPRPTKQQAPTINATLWCANPAHPQDSRAPRHGRHRHCRFCRHVLATHGTLPTAALLDRHDRGITLTDELVRALLAG